MRDYEIRRHLKESGFHSNFLDTSSKVVDELEVGFGDSRIDIAVINGSFHGYEIKSNHDTLFRLERQLKEYVKAFDFLTFVVGNKHINHVKKIIPDWCGLIEVSDSKDNNGKLHYDILNIASCNVATDTFTIAQFLWRDECIDVLRKKDIKKGLTSKNRLSLWQMISEIYSKDELSNEVRAILKSRTGWRE